MIGFNGGLIGRSRPTLLASSIPGVWTSREQEVAVRNGTWSGPLLLNIYTGATAAYSLRNLLQGGESSAVVQVRRSSGSPAEANFTALQVTNGELATWVGAGNNGFVKTWYDQSGNGNNATQSTDSNQPQIVTGGTLIFQAGKPCLQFAEGTTALNASSLAGKSRLDSYCVKNTSDTEYILFSDPASNSRYSFVASSGSNDTNLTNTYGSPSLYGNNSLFTGTTRGNVYTSLNGYRLEVHENAVTTAWGNFDIGRYNNTSSFKYAGTIQELIFYASNQSGNRVGIQNNINAYYGIYT